MRRISITLLALCAQVAWGQSSKFVASIKKNLTENAPRVQRIQSNFKPDTVVVYNRSGLSPVPDTRLIYTYDTQQRPINIRIQTQDTGSWEVIKRLDVQYNASGLPTQSDEWELLNGVLSPSKRTARTYNTQGRMTLNKVYSFAQGVPTLESGDSIIYNGAGVNPTTIDLFNFDANNSTWERTLRFRNLTFNNQNQLTQVSFAIQAGSIFIDALRAQNMDWKAGYSTLLEAALGEDFAPMIPDGFRWEPQTLSWSGPTNATIQENQLPNWVNVQRRLQTLTANQLASVAEETWNDTIAIPAWEPEQKTLFTFSNNQLTELVKQNVVNNAYVNDFRERFVLAGPQGLPTVYETYVWANNAWSSDNLNTFNYGLDGQSRLTFMSKTISVFGNQQPADSLAFLYRTSTATTNDGIAITSAHIYPNPVHDGMAQIKFDQPFLGTIQLRDLSGKVIQQFLMNNETTHAIPVNGLAKGLYLVQWTNPSNQTSTGKLIIQ